MKKRTNMDSILLRELNWPYYPGSRTKYTMDGTTILHDDYRNEFV